jgi:hypothetical protein
MTNELSANFQSIPASSFIPTWQSREVYSDQFGRVIEVNNIRSLHIYFVVHSWNDEDHLSFRIEPKRFHSESEATNYLHSLAMD